MHDRHNLSAVITRLCDGSQVDWTAAEESARDDDERESLRHLRTVAGVSAMRPGQHMACGLRSRLVPIGCLLVLGLASIKTLLALAGCLTALVLPAWHSPVRWPYLVSLLTFGSAGGTLLVAGARDSQTRRLGGLFLVIASAFSDTVPLGDLTWRVSWWPTATLQGLTSDAFLACALWMFVSVFPTTARRTFDRRVGRAFIAVTACAGLLLLLANVSLRVPTIGSLLEVRWFAQLFDRQTPGQGYYWLTLFGLAAPALPYLLWRSRFGAQEDRRRVTLFTAALAVGIAPMIVAVILSLFFPFFRDPAHRELIGVPLYLLLLSIVPATGYSVVVHHVFDLSLLVRRTIQHRLARYFICGVTSAPVVAFAIYLYCERHTTLAEALAGLATVTLLPVIVVSAVVLVARRRLLSALDRVFLRQPVNHGQAVTELDRQLQQADGVLDVAGIVAREIDRAMHPHTVAVLLVDGTAHRLTSAEGVPPPLDLDTPLGMLVARAGQEIQVGRTTSPIWNLIEEDDRRWLASGGFRLLLPFTGRGGRLIGTVALGEKRSELPYSPEDCLLLKIMTARAAIGIENCRLRHLRGIDSPPPTDAIDWRYEPAVQCPNCLRVCPPSTRACRCGAPTEPAALPVLVLGKFRLQRVLGSGGMGIVYLAVDVALDRKVAIKTLPRLTADKARRLEREARAMARIQHPNLAVIFGIERWDERPLLIVEYLEGGSLADRMLHTTLAPLEAISLGVVLADVLDRLHASGVLHRDIKPSNIGYSPEGVPKLMDFGLACSVKDTTETVNEAGRSAACLPQVHLASWSSYHLAGTLAYFSPEAVAGAAPDESFDLWSLALVLYHTIAGVNPLAQEDPFETVDHIVNVRVPDIREFCPACPVPVAMFFRDTLAASLRSRPGSAADFRSRCQRLRADLAIRSR